MCNDNRIRLVFAVFALFIRLKLDVHFTCTFPVNDFLIGLFGYVLRQVAVWRHNHQITLLGIDDIDRVR